VEIVFQVSIDWMQFTIPEETPVNETIGELLYYLDCDFKDLGHGALGYENLAIGAGGAKVLTSSKRPEHHVILPGEWCRAVGPEMCCIILGWIFDHNGHFTRIDLAGDDYSKVVSPKGVAVRCEKGQLVSHCHNISRIYDVMGKQQDGVYIGSPASVRRLRVYDKNKQSKGEIDSIRWELQLRDEAADRAAELVLNRNLPEAYLATLVGLAGFRKVSGDNVSRRPRAPWFKKLVGEAQKATLSKPQQVKTIEKTENWLRKQVSPSLAMVVEAGGGDLAILEDMAIDGRKRLKPIHRIAIEESLKKRVDE